jgi:hypothetical protein
VVANDLENRYHGKPGLPSDVFHRDCHFFHYVPWRQNTETLRARTAPRRSQGGNACRVTGVIRVTEPRPSARMAPCY